jgi:hypothetical protein
MPRCRFVRSGHIEPAISGLTACQIAARRRTWLIKARRPCVAAFRLRPKRQQQTDDHHRRGAEPEDSGYAHTSFHCRSGRSPDRLNSMVCLCIPNGLCHHRSISGQVGAASSRLVCASQCLLSSHRRRRWQCRSTTPPPQLAHPRSGVGRTRLSLSHCIDDRQPDSRPRFGAATRKAPVGCCRMVWIFGSSS